MERCQIWYQVVCWQFSKENRSKRTFLLHIIFGDFLPAFGVVVLTQHSPHHQNTKITITFTPTITFCQHPPPTAPLSLESYCSRLLPTSFTQQAPPRKKVCTAFNSIEAHIVAFYEGTDRPAQRVEPAELTGAHQWSTQPEVNPSFEVFVETNTAPRCDMARYKSITMREMQDGKDAWSSLCKSRSLFRVPETLPCDRTFVRDNEEVYYIDKMNMWLKGFPENITVQDIPFVKRSLHHRLMYAFSRGTGYFNELFERRRTGLLLPYDAHENKYYGDVELHERHPRVDAWLQEIDEPPSLPVPLPFVAFYYHTELLEAQRLRGCGMSLPERQRRLLFCLEHEYYVLFLAMWWSEAFYGGRQFVLSTRTIDVLSAHCGNLAVSGIKPVQVIIEYMRTASTRSSSMYVWLAFRENWMEESTFVWAKKGSGEHDPQQIPVRTTLWADKNCRRITMTAYSAKIYKRNTALDKKLGDPDLDKILGLLDLVYEQNWNLHGDMRVGDLVTNLLQLYNATRGVVDTLVKQGVGAAHSEFRYRDDRYHPHHNDFYIIAEPSRPRIGYHDGCNYPDDRYCYDRYRDDDRFRSHRNTPAPQPRYNGSRNYNQDKKNRIPEAYDDTQVRHVLHVVRDHAAEERAPPSSPNYTPAEVYDITDNTPRGDSAARRSISQDVGPSTSQNPPLISTSRGSRERVQSPALRPGGWGHKLFEAAKKDLREKSASVKPANLTTATPFMKVASTSKEANRQPDQASGNPTHSNETNDRCAGPVILPNTDYANNACGNVSWDVVGRDTSKLKLRDFSEQGRKGGSKFPRVYGSGTADNPEKRRQRDEQDPVLRQLCSRHPTSKARHLALVVRERSAKGDK